MEAGERSEKEINKQENEMPAEESHFYVQGTENRLRGAVLRIVPDESVRERIIAGAKTGKHGRSRLSVRIPAAVFAACLFLSLLFLAKPGIIGEEVVVYAATEDYGWQRLVEGERILLKKEPYETPGEDEAIDDFGKDERPLYYPYICTFRLELPENYLYGKQFTTLRDDYIGERGGRIEWIVAPDRPEDAGRVMQGELSIWIVDENRERMAALRLELTKEDGKCYAELKRGWESEVYKKERYKKWGDR